MTRMSRSSNIPTILSGNYKSLFLLILAFFCVSLLDVLGIGLVVPFLLISIGIDYGSGPLATVGNWLSNNTTPLGLLALILVFSPSKHFR